MRIGVPKEIKEQEHRVGLTPSGARHLVQRGHHVLIEQHAGLGSGFSDEAYLQAGAIICEHTGDLFADSQLIVKVKEPLAIERARLHEEQILFTYLHLAADARQTQELMRSQCTCFAYETITNAQHQLPLLIPMSEIAGRLSAQAGARALEKTHSGRGILMSGIAGVSCAHVVIIGAGIAGANAAYIALGMGARVTLMDRNVERLRYLEQHYQGKLQTLYANNDTIRQILPQTDVLICAALQPGAKAPQLINRKQLALMRQGSVIVDIAIDQGGCCESSVATTHQNPTYLVDGIVHYCVANMPAAVAHTSTLALTQVTLPYIQQLAEKPLNKIKMDPELLSGLNVYQGHITQLQVANSLNLSYHDPEQLIP